MRTRIEIENGLMEEAMQMLATKTPNETIETALKQLVKLKKRKTTPGPIVKTNWDEVREENKDWFQ